MDPAVFVNNTIAWIAMHSGGPHGVPVSDHIVGPTPLILRDKRLISAKTDAAELRAKKAVSSNHSVFILCRQLPIDKDRLHTKCVTLLGQCDPTCGIGQLFRVDPCNQNSRRQRVAQDRKSTRLNS